MHAVFLSGPVDRRAFRYLQAGPLFSNAYAAKSLQAFRYLRPSTDPPGPASIVEACFGRCQARLHAGQPGWAA